MPETGFLKGRTAEEALDDLVDNVIEAAGDDKSETKLTELLESYFYGNNNNQKIRNPLERDAKDQRTIFHALYYKFGSYGIDPDGSETTIEGAIGEKKKWLMMQKPMQSLMNLVDFKNSDHSIQIQKDIHFESKPADYKDSPYLYHEYADKKSLETSLQEVYKNPDILRKLMQDNEDDKQLSDKINSMDDNAVFTGSLSYTILTEYYQDKLDLQAVSAACTSSIPVKPLAEKRKLENKITRYEALITNIYGQTNQNNQNYLEEIGKFLISEPENSSNKKDITSVIETLEFESEFDKIHDSSNTNSSSLPKMDEKTSLLELINNDPPKYDDFILQLKWLNQKRIKVNFGAEGVEKLKFLANNFPEEGVLVRAQMVACGELLIENDVKIGDANTNFINCIKDSYPSIIVDERASPNILQEEVGKAREEVNDETRYFAPQTGELNNNITFALNNYKKDKNNNDNFDALLKALKNTHDTTADNKKKLLTILSDKFYSDNFSKDDKKMCIDAAAILIKDGANVEDFIAAGSDANEKIQRKVFVAESLGALTNNEINGLETKNELLSIFSNASVPDSHKEIYDAVAEMLIAQGAKTIADNSFVTKSNISNQSTGSSTSTTPYNANNSQNTTNNTSIEGVSTSTNDNTQANSTGAQSVTSVAAASSSAPEVVGAEKGDSADTAQSVTFATPPLQPEVSLHDKIQNIFTSNDTNAVKASALETLLTDKNDGEIQSLNAEKFIDGENNEISLIHIASAFGNKNLVSKIITAAPDSINALDSYNNTPLMGAILSNNYEAAEAFFEHKQNDKGQYIPLVVGTLLENNEGKTALDLAVEELDSSNYPTLMPLINQIWQQDLAHSQSPNTIDYKHQATFNTIKEKLEGFTNIDTTNKVQNILYINSLDQGSDEKTARSNAKEALDKLAFSESELKDSTTPKYKYYSQDNKTVELSLLDIASTFGNDDLVSNIIAADSTKVDTPNKDGVTPLMYAAKNGNDSIVSLLITNGADVNAQDKDEKTPLMYAAKNGHNDTMRLLITNGADVNAQDHDLMTPLMHAIINEHYEAAEVFFEHKQDDQGKDIPLVVDTLLENKEGKTALDLAVEGLNASNYEQLVQLIKEMWKQDLTLADEEHIRVHDQYVKLSGVIADKIKSIEDEQGNVLTGNEEYFNSLTELSKTMNNHYTLHSLWDLRDEYYEVHGKTTESVSSFNNALKEVSQELETNPPAQDVIDAADKGQDYKPLTQDGNARLKEYIRTRLIRQHALSQTGVDVDDSDTYQGIGATLITREDGQGLQIIDLVPGGPAKNMGLEQGNIITSVDDIDLTNQELKGDVLSFKQINGDLVPFETVVAKIRAGKGIVVLGREKAVDITNADIDGENNQTLVKSIDKRRDEDLKFFHLENQKKITAEKQEKIQANDDISELLVQEMFRKDATNLNYGELLKNQLTNINPTPDNASNIDFNTIKSKAEYISALFELGADVNYVHSNDKVSYTAFMAAAKNGDVESMKLIYEKDPTVINVTTTNSAGVIDQNGFSSGDTPLMWAAAKGHLEVVKYLQDLNKNNSEEEKKKYINAQNKLGGSALTYAVDHNQPEVVKALMAFGADINIRDTVGDTVGDTHLIKLIKTPQYSIVTEIPEIKRDNNGKRVFGENDILDDEDNWIGVKTTPVDLKILVPLLLDNGADINAKGQSGMTALMWAASNGNKEVVDILLKNPKINVSVKDKFDHTALYYAVSSGNTEIVELLLTKGKAQFDKSKDLLSAALLKLLAIDTSDKLSISENERSKMATLLVQAGADVNCKNTRSNTPLFLAAKNSNKEVVELLLKNGSLVNEGCLDAALSPRIVNSDVSIASKTSIDIAVSLIEKGAPVNEGSMSQIFTILKTINNKGERTTYIDKVIACVQQKDLPLVFIQAAQDFKNNTGEQTEVLNTITAKDQDFDTHLTEYLNSKKTVNNPVLPAFEGAVEFIQDVQLKLRFKEIKGALSGSQTPYTSGVATSTRGGGPKRTL